MTGREPITVVAGVLWRAGRLLVTRRADDDPLGPVWEFPGGKVEPGETPARALARELREELGVDVEVGEELERIRHDYDHVSITLIVLRCPRFAGEPEGREGQALAWLRPDELADYRFPAADAQLLARLPVLAARWAAEGGA